MCNKRWHTFCNMDSFIITELPGFEDTVQEELPTDTQASSSSVSLSSSPQHIIIKPGQRDKSPDNDHPGGQTFSLSQNDRQHLDMGDHIMAEMFDLKEQTENDVSFGNDVIRGVGAPLSLVHRPSCRGMVCANNGTCVVERSVVKCNCLMGTVGRRCERCEYYH